MIPETYFQRVECDISKRTDNIKIKRDLGRSHIETAILNIYPALPLDKVNYGRDSKKLS